MKTKILMGSAGLVVLATTVGVSSALFVEGAEKIARFGTVGGILALGSVGLFFVGLVFPKEG